MKEEKKATRQSYGEALLELGNENDNIVVLDADLSTATKTELFAKEFPNRFFDMGIAESNMMSTAAGIATCGKTVYASTFAVFAAGRAYDQIRSSICYPNNSWRRWCYTSNDRGFSFNEGITKHDGNFSI